jgi:AcrR family transcriptional regulator
MSGLGTKELIQRTALPLFVECGLGETSMHDVAESAGVSQGAVCNHYASKGESAWSLFSTALRPASAEPIAAICLRPFGG